MTTVTPAKKRLQIGDYDFDPAVGALSRRGSDDDARRLEPKVAALLGLLANRGGELVPREDVMASLWPDVVVGDDALPRCVLKLRRALGDDAKAPRYVETVPKRGYRLVAPVAVHDGDPGPGAEPAGEIDGGASGAAPVDLRPPPSADAIASTRVEHPAPTRSRSLALALVAAALALGLGFALLRPPPPEASGSVDGASVAAPDSAAVGVAQQLVDRADDYYSAITRPGNESAIALYEQALAADPEHARAHAGLANALVQRVLRYPDAPTPDLDEVNLESALKAGRLATPAARHHLGRALGLAERSVRLEPESAASLKALGFVTAALGRLDEADRIYTRAVELDPDAWDVLINLGDIHGIRGDEAEALRYFELAYAAMERVWTEQKVRVSPWLGELGVIVGERHRDAGRSSEAEVWFRRVLAYAPLHPRATCELASLLRDAGDSAAARRLETELADRLGDDGRCVSVDG
ncbi:MAG: winged helix-turn-helix domain-containing protein [Acidobacteriota bacterium]